MVRGKVAEEQKKQLKQNPDKRKEVYSLGKPGARFVLSDGLKYTLLPEVWEWFRKTPVYETEFGASVPVADAGSPDEWVLEEKEEAVSAPVEEVPEDTNQQTSTFIPTTPEGGSINVSS